MNIIYIKIYKMSCFITNIIYPIFREIQDINGLKEIIEILVDKKEYDINYFNENFINSMLKILYDKFEEPMIINNEEKTIIVKYKNYYIINYKENKNNIMIKIENYYKKRKLSN